MVGKRSNKGLNEIKELGREAAEALYEAAKALYEAAEALYEATGWKRSRKSLVRGVSRKAQKKGEDISTNPMMIDR